MNKLIVASAVVLMSGLACADDSQDPAGYSQASAYGATRAQPGYSSADAGLDQSGPGDLGRPWQADSPANSDRVHRGSLIPDNLTVGERF
jgi:opacity protein-like surface antigen